MGWSGPSEFWKKHSSIAVGISFHSIVSDIYTAYVTILVIFWATQHPCVQKQQQQQQEARSYGGIHVAFEILTLHLWALWMFRQCFHGN